MTDLVAFFQAHMAAHAPWNCSTMPSSWCVANGHPDFAARWRDVTDPTACDAAALDGGGLLDLWVRDIGDGLARTDEPARGDIGVIEVFGLATGGICTGDKWAIEGARTLHFLSGENVRVLGAWRV